MATIDQIQSLEIERRGILLSPHTNLQDNTGVVGFNGDPNIITQAQISTDAGRALLWYVNIGTHYINYSSQEYVKIAMPTGSDMTNCWKKISFESGGSGYVEKDSYNAYTVLAATDDNNPLPIVLTENSVLGRIGNTIQSILIDTDLSIGTNDNHDTLASAKAIIEYVNSSIAGALTFKGGYDVSTDTTDKGGFQLVGSNKPVILRGDTYVITVGGTFFTTVLGVGDMIIASEANPTTLSGWTLVVKNIPDIVDASTTVKGIVQLATVIDNNEVKAVTPKLVKDAITTATDTILNGTLKKYVYLISNPSGSTTTSFTISAVVHGITNGDLNIKVKDVTTGETVETDTSVTPVTNDVVIKFSNPPADNNYKVIIIG